MEIQNYLILENNVVINLVVWDGNTDTWTPPENTTCLVQATTPAMIWQYNNPTWVLTEVMGAGQIGFTWDGVILMTNQTNPALNSKIKN